MQPYNLNKVIDDTFSEMSRSRENYAPEFQPQEKGIVKNVSSGIAKVSGLPGTGFEELLKFPGNLYGIAFNLDEDETGVVLLGNDEHLQAGDVVERTNRVTDIPVGDGLIGRVINPLGEPLMTKAPLHLRIDCPSKGPPLQL